MHSNSSPQKDKDKEEKLKQREQREEEEGEEGNSEDEICEEQEQEEEDWGQGEEKVEKGESSWLEPEVGEAGGFQQDVQNGSQEVKELNTKQAVLQEKDQSQKQETNTQNVQSVQNVKEKQPEIKVKPKYKQKQRQQTYKKAGEYKTFFMQFDSRLVCSAHELLRQDLKAKIPPEEGFINFDTRKSANRIILCYFEEQNKEKLARIIEQELEEIQVIGINKNQATNGIQLSGKYNSYLQKNKMAIFKDNSQQYSTSSYYICGKVPTRKMLHEKVLEIRKLKFLWLHLFCFENTRSYRAILRKIFNTPEMHQQIKKMKAQEIEVASLKWGFDMPSNIKKRGVLIVITMIDEKKLAIHQEIEQNIYNFIKETFAVFCFVFKRNTKKIKTRYVPKVENVHWFFLNQTTDMNPTTYLYIIVSRQIFPNVREQIIKEIKQMGIEVTGRRYLKNLFPAKPNTVGEQYYERYFPSNFAYSWKHLRKDGGQIQIQKELVLE